MQNSVLKTASLAVLLIGLWLMLEGVWNAVSLVFTFQDIGNLQIDLSGTSGVLIVLWKILPFFVGYAIFNRSDGMVRWFCRKVDKNILETLTWTDTGSLSSLAVGILGLLFLSFGISQFSDENMIRYFILELSDPGLSELWENDSGYISILSRIYSILPVIYPLFAGSILLSGSRRIGSFMEKRIEHFLDTDSTDQGQE